MEDGLRAPWSGLSKDDPVRTSLPIIMKPSRSLTAVGDTANVQPHVSVHAAWRAMFFSWQALLREKAKKSYLETGPSLWESERRHISVAWLLGSSRHPFLSGQR